MTPQELLGWIMVVAPALALFVAAWRISGPLVLVAVLGISAAVPAYMFMAVYLIGAI